MKLQGLANILSKLTKKHAGESVLVHMLDHMLVVPYNANRPSHDFVQISLPNNHFFPKKLHMYC